MSEYIVRGGHMASGTVRVEGAKNAVLPILSACILVNGVCILDNVPQISDVDITINILKVLGCIVEKEISDGRLRVRVDARNAENRKIPEILAGQLRSSIVFMGALLGRFGCARGCLPGGCKLGERPIDMHLTAFEEMGFELEQVTSWDISVKKAVCTYSDKCIVLPFPSVGATENILMAALARRGTTIIKNAAREPEIVDLQNFLLKAGYNICGAGSGVIIVRGRRKNYDKCIRLHHRIIPDRIVAATYMCVAAVTRGCVLIENVCPNHVKPMVVFLRNCGCSVEVMANSICVECHQRLKSEKQIIETSPYPGFPTDMQPLATVVLSLASGCSMVKENIFSNRFEFVSQLNKFGTDIIINDEVANICGVTELSGCDCVAEDLRGGAALVLAALAAYGESRISGVEYIERGYENFVDCLRRLGLDIE